jgi:ParB family chromosome partitioning protein
MGRGLSAILPTRSDEISVDELRQVPVSAVQANPNQPRTSFEDEALKGLSESIKQSGVLQPLLVRPLIGGQYELVAGERRLRAARIAGLETVPAYVRAGLDANTLELALVENMARVDLNPIDAARACAALVDDLGLSKEEVSRRVGKSRVAVSNLIRLLNLPDEVVALVEGGQLSEGHARAILRANDHFTRRRLANLAIEHNWSVRETERRAEEAADADASPNRQVETESSASRSDAAEAEEAAALLAQRFGAIAGQEPVVKVGARGVKVRFDFATIDEALAIAEQLERR